MAGSCKAVVISVKRLVFASISKVPPNTHQASIKLLEIIAHGGNFNHIANLSLDDEVMLARIRMCCHTDHQITSHKVFAKMSASSVPSMEG